MLPLAPSFDTVGWLTRDLATLDRVVRVMLPEGSRAASGAAIPEVLLSVLDPAVVQAFRSAVALLVERGGFDKPDDVELPDVKATYAAFRTVQAAEAWRVHGPWLTEHPGSVSGAVADRFRVAAAVTPDEERRARNVLAEARGALRALLAERTLLLPSAASPAPQASAGGAEVDRVRGATLTLTCLAAVAGAPSLSAPLARVGGAPLGVALVSAPGSDRSLLELAGALVDETAVP
ncbi:amidase family protein [Naasia aerilata]|uniref:Amidase n=1 Tax=Naasia aerilata TaxID=1162966 RepID=A0ABN6XL35_9MICO|nr:amidase family protein [Naasia aerilata]BDZ45655.1 hypothetical protein GCM10025866_15640 [Naasia aerilata]